MLSLDLRQDLVAWTLFNALERYRREGDREHKVANTARLLRALAAEQDAAGETQAHFLAWFQVWRGESAAAAYPGMTLGVGDGVVCERVCPACG